MDQNWESRSEKRKMNGANEKPKLDNAGRLRGIYFIDPEDEEDKEMEKNVTRKPEVQMDAAMPCRTKTKA